MKILLKLLTIFAVLCTVACSQTFENVSNNNLSSNSDTKSKGLLAMNVGEMSRTITNTLTNADIHSAVLTANNETVGNWSGEDVIGQIESDKSITLDVDYYDFVLSVKNEAGKTLATAQTSKYIEVGTNHISLSLKSVTTGEGSFEVTFSWQSDYVNSIKAGLYDCETDEEITGCEMAALTVTDKTAVYAKDDLPVGQYILMLNFYDDSDGLLKTYTEVLRVEAYRKTTATRQFAGFNTEHTIEYVLTESWESDFTPVTERNAAEEVKLPTIENVDTEKDVTSYILKWYTTETFETGTEIKKIEAGTDKDMKLYGQIETCYRTTADGFLKTIQSLTVGGPYNVIVTGELTSSQLSTMATYIKNYSTRKINLDLSETTGLTYINSYTFENCTGLVNIIIPESVTSIDREAFENCSSLTGITIPDSVTEIGYCWYCGDEYYCDIEREFTGCSSLTAFNVSKNNRRYSSSDDGKILYNKDKTTLLAYPSATGDVTIPDSVTEIGDDAFYNCDALTSVTIPNSVTEIGDDAFENCGSLTSVTIPDSVTSIGSSAFYDCSSLESVTIGNSVTYIGSCAFYNCSSLESVTIPDSVTSIDSSAFWDCSSLTSVHITDLTAWMNIKFENASSNPLYYGADLYLNGSSVTDLVIPAGMTSIGSFAFYNYDALTSVTIGDGVTSIGENAFSGCDNLEITINTDDKYLYSKDGTTILLCDSSVTSVTIPENVASINYGAFACCRNVETIETGDTLMSLSGLPITSALKSITIGNGVTSINEDRFKNCSNLESVTIGNSVMSIGSDAFTNCSNLESVTIPDSVTSIGSGAFENCSSLTSVVIPDSVTSIGHKAFYNCSSLESVTIGDSVTSIGSSAFENCSSLESVTIGNSVTSIGSSAFENCNNLTSVHITDLTAWKNIEFYNSYSNPLYYGAKLYLNGSLAEFTVTFDAVGGVWNGEAVQTITSGEKVAEPTEPSKTGYVFYGWYTSAETLSSTAYNFDTVIKKDITLYAKWVDETVGYIAYSDGSISADYDSTKIPVGIVIEATDGTATKIVSLTQTSAKWSTEEVVTNATSATDGVANMAAIQSISGWEQKYPAFKWCDEYTDWADNSEWYLPAKDELDQLYTVKDYVNAAIEKITAGDDTVTKLGTGWYWSSSQYDLNDAWDQRFSDGYQSSYYKDYTYSVRAVRAF